MKRYHASKDTVSASGAEDVVPSNVTVFPVSRALYVGAPGNLTVRMAEGMQRTFLNVPVGIFPIQVDMVFTSSTASGLLALY